MATVRAPLKEQGAWVPPRGLRPARPGLFDQPRATAQNLPSAHWQMISGVPNELVQMQMTWQVTNRGGANGRVGMRFRLEADRTFFIDTIQWEIRENGSIQSDQFGGAITVLSRNYPLTLAPGATTNCSLVLRIPAGALLDRQDNITNFRVWVGEMELRHPETGEMLAKENGDDAQFEHRDWFEVVSAVPRLEGANTPLMTVGKV